MLWCYLLAEYSSCFTPSLPPLSHSNTGKSIQGMTSCTNLKKWALGKEYRDDPWQGFTSPQFQELMSKTGDDGEKDCKSAFPPPPPPLLPLLISQIISRRYKQEHEINLARAILCFICFSHLLLPQKVYTCLNNDTDYPSIPRSLIISSPDMDKYSDHSWILRYRKERDNALAAHKKQYNRRIFWSRFGLAKAPQGDAFERFIEIDRQKEAEQEVKKGWVKPLRSRSAPVSVGSTKSILGRSEKKKKKEEDSKRGRVERR